MPRFKAKFDDLLPRLQYSCEYSFVAAPTRLRYAERSEHLLSADSEKQSAMHMLGSTGYFTSLEHECKMDGHMLTF